MVTISNYKEREREDGSFFFVLEVQGGVELLQSQKTGQFYATSKKAYLPCTFNEKICQTLIGNTLEGSIYKQECEPFTFVVPETGEAMSLSHRWVFTPEEPQEKKTKVDNYLDNLERSFNNTPTMQTAFAH